MAAKRKSRKGRELKIRVVLPKELAGTVERMTEEEKERLEALFSCALVFAVDLPRSAQAKVCKE